MNELNQLKHIVLSTENYKKLQRLGFAGESFNDVLDRVLATEKEQVKGNK